MATDPLCFSSWMTVTNLPGEYGFIFTVLFGCLIAFGPVSFLRLSTVMLSVTMVASIIKLTIASPRPFYIIPALQKVAIFLINDYVPRQYQRLNLRYLLGLITCLLIGCSVILYSGYMLINLSNVSLIVLAIRSITIVVLITWILGCSSWFYRHTCSSSTHVQQAN
ncbi:hypothetical protein ETN89_11240 [Photobacterium damselae subsp. damselae]|uniref:hypothetical protein n=1 Tax=Photobacterium damselae TaxID=38293 RepID=UPI0010115894|nr:hypothetical protein [Photobacterium damselae]QAY35840.1 hypothetical protein ETN89_11240 [Photobacterium damselae subsp. damselae]